MDVGKAVSGVKYVYNYDGSCGKPEDFVHNGTIDLISNHFAISHRGNQLEL